MYLMASFYAVLLSHEMSLMGSGTYLSQFLRVFLPSLLLKPVLGGVAGCTSLLVMNRLNKTKFAIFISDVLLASKGSYYSELIYTQIYTLATAFS